MKIMSILAILVSINLAAANALAACSVKSTYWQQIKLEDMVGNGEAWELKPSGTCERVAVSGSLDIAKACKKIVADRELGCFYIGKILTYNLMHVESAKKTVETQFTCNVCL